MTEIPESLLRRSAEAKAKALGIPVEQVLAEMRGEAPPAPRSRRRTAAGTSRMRRWKKSAEESRAERSRCDRGAGVVSPKAEAPHPNPKKEAARTRTRTSRWGVRVAGGELRARAGVEAEQEAPAQL